MRKSTNYAASVLAIGVALAATTVQAQQAADTTQDTTEVTVTATRYAKKVADAPATVSVIGARQIEDNMALDLKDLIRYEPGVSVRNAPARFTAAGATTGRDGNAGFNIRGISLGALVQNLTTGAKYLALVLLVLAAFLLGARHPAPQATTEKLTPEQAGALLAADGALSRKEVKSLLASGAPADTVRQEVERRGVSFTPSPELTSEIEAAGGTP